MMQPIPPIQETAPDDELIPQQFDFTGQWLPDLHPLKVPSGNYSDCQNIRYTKTGIIDVKGYTRINTNPLVTYVKGRGGFQLRTPHTQKSYVITHQWNSALNGSVLTVNKGVPPAVTDFEATYLHVDAANAEYGRFAETPNGEIVYCNAVESLIYGGEESPVSAFFLATPTTLVNPISYTDAIMNTLTTTGNTVVVAAASNVYLVGSTRPLDRIKPYISSANASAGATVDVKEWTGAAWSSCTNIVDGTKLSNITHAVTGTISFDSTVATSKPFYFAEALLYWYQVILSTGTCTIYHCTVGMPMQKLVDIWDSINRVCIQCQVSRSGIYEDYTAEVYDASNIQYPISANFSGITSSDHVILMFSSRTTAVKMAFLAGLINTTASAPTIYYWNGTTWATVGTVYDGTVSGSTSMYQNGTIYWDAPAENLEHKVNMFSVWGYAYKFVWSAGLSAHTVRDIQGLSRAASCVVTWANHGLIDNAVVKFSGITQTDWTALNATAGYAINVIDADTFSIAVNTSGYAADYLPGTDPGKICVMSGLDYDGCHPDTIYGIPAVRNMGAYKFAFNYKNRLFLAGDSAGKEGHGIDYGMKDTSDTFNGKDSSADGRRLYVGKNSSDVLAAANVFNRFGANIYNSEIILKPTEAFLLDGEGPETYKVSQISEHIGIIAPRTLCTAEVAFEVTKEAIRNIAMWISSVGPIIFDAAVLVPLGGIACYFDVDDARCVNFAAMNNAHGWFDPNTYEWNVCLPSGTGQTTCNVWLTYHLIHKRWSKINTGSKLVPQATFKVISDGGSVYFYGLTDNGHMVILENGNLWDGTEAIESFVVTNAMIPTGSMFDTSLLRNITLLTECDGSYDIAYTRSDIAIEGSGIATGDLNVYGSIIEDPSCTASYWDGENFICKEIIEHASILIPYQDVSGVVSIQGDANETWVMQISTVAGDFVAAGFAPGMFITTSDPNNPGPFLCTTVTTNLMTFASGKAVEFIAGPSITISAMFANVTHYKNESSTASVLPFNKVTVEDNFAKFAASCGFTGLCHKIKFSFYSSALGNNIKPIAWGYRYQKEHSELT